MIDHNEFTVHYETTMGAGALVLEAKEYNYFETLLLDEVNESSLGETLKRLVERYNVVRPYLKKRRVVKKSFWELFS